MPGFFENDDALGPITAPVDVVVGGIPEVDIHIGDCRETMRSLTERSVHCMVTSPPYFNLRDYGTGEWTGGDPQCDHRIARGGQGERSRLQTTNGGTQHYHARDVCPRCGARRTDQQIGNETRLAEYIHNLALVFSEVHRVLRDDGVAWLNLGDTYASTPSGNKSPTGLQQTSRKRLSVPLETYNAQHSVTDLPHKNLLMVPHRVAIALQQAGWYVRNDIIWHKPAPTPTSATDRATNCHEHIFMLTKRPQYFYDQEAVREKPKGFRGAIGSFGKAHERDGAWYMDGEIGANMRDVWTIGTEAFSDIHFATFPAELPARCIRASTSAKGACGRCGAPVRRLVPRMDKRAGWEATCRCGVDLVPCTVLDPFGGIGTTGLAAALLGRHGVLCELNPHYARSAAQRLALYQVPARLHMPQQQQPIRRRRLFAEVTE